MKIFTSRAIHELDSATCEAQQISSIDLMERAAELVADELNSRFLPGQRFVVMAEPEITEGMPSPWHVCL